MQVPPLSSTTRSDWQNININQYNKRISTSLNRCQNSNVGTQCPSSTTNTILISTRSQKLSPSIGSRKSRNTLLQIKYRSMMLEPSLNGKESQDGNWPKKYNSKVPRHKALRQWSLWIAREDHLLWSFNKLSHNNTTRKKWIRIGGAQSQAWYRNRKMIRKNLSINCI